MENYNPNYFGKVPPNVIKIEAAILSDCMQNSKMVSIYASILKPDYFYKEVHQEIYKTILELDYEDTAPDVLQIVERLKKNNKLEEVGGAYIIASISSLYTSSITINAKKNALLVFEKYILREAIALGDETTRKAYDEIDVFELIEYIQGVIDDITSKMDFSDISGVSAVETALKKIEDAYDGKEISYIRSGFEKLDSSLYMNVRQIIVLAASNGMGKTKLMLNLLQGMFANNKNVSCMFFSLEEPATKMALDQISLNTKISAKKLQSKLKKKLNKEEIENVEKWHDIIKKQDIVYIERSPNISSIKRKFKAFCKKRPDNINLLIVDNLGLVTADGYRNQTERDDHIANQFVKIRDETNGLIFVIHHLAKAAISSDNENNGQRPLLNHIRGSSRITDYANSTLLINFIAKHKKIIQEESKKIFNIEIDHDAGVEGYARILYKINSKPDRAHTAYDANYFFQSIKNLVRNNMSINNMLETFPEMAYRDATELVIRKYNNVFSYQESINNARKLQYRTPPMDIITYFKDAVYKRAIDYDTESKHFYLYGNNPDKYRKIIKNLLIIDIAKNREGSPDDDDTLIRCIANLEMSLIKEY